jgi:hypothetical protein
VISLFSALGFLATSHRLEVVFLEVVGDLLTEHRSLRVGGAEVDASPDSGVDDLLERVREAVEAPRRTGFVAECTEAYPVGAEKVLERVHECTARASVAGRMIRKGRRDEQRWVADRYRWVEQRQPCRISLGGRIAIGVGLADCRDRAPELPIVLVVPAANLRISRSKVLHREEPGAFDDVQPLTGGQRAKDPVPERYRMVLPEDRSIGFVCRSGRAGE